MRNGWIDVNDRLPNNDDMVLLLVPDYEFELHVEIAEYQDNMTGKYFVVDSIYSYEYDDKRIVAWQPLPSKEH